MKLSRIEFKEPVFDPKSSKGADNVRKFYRIDEGYEIELDVASGIAKVSCNGRHNCVHVSNAKEWRELVEDVAVQVAPAAPKMEVVKLAEGAYKLVPKAPEPVVVVPDEEPIPPRKRGRPRKEA